IHGEEVEVKAEIYNMEGFSAHADHDEMLEWLHGFKHMPGRMFMTHGEEESTVSWAAEISEKFGVNAIAPEHGYCFDLATDAAGEAVVHPASIVHPEAAATAADAASDTARTLDAELLLEINADIQRVMASRDVDKLIRLRDYLRRIR
ncbi:MAG: hypothetical protein IIY40_01215, partial [Firmicutes bacterium]|nr:hypothetical protein [Bacillota bacterium]